MWNVLKTNYIIPWMMKLVWNVIIICCMNKIGCSPGQFTNSGKSNGICYLLTHYCLCHVCQRWHYDIQTGQQATSKQTIVGYVIQCCSMIQLRLETVAWSWQGLNQVKHCVSGICTTDLWRIIKDINTSSYRPWFLVWPWVAKFVFSRRFYIQRSF